MSGFFSKVASAFVEVEDEDGGRKREGDVSLDAITSDAQELLAQLGDDHGQGAESKDSPEFTAGGTSSGAVVGAPRPAVPQGPKMGMTADQVFVAAGLVDGPNSSERVLKLIGGLAMFPPEQQVVMVRAMDTADDTWSESDVLEDARARQSVLRKHLTAIESECQENTTALKKLVEQTRAEGEHRVATLDAEIAQLQKQREEVVVEITTRISELNQEMKTLDNNSDSARRGITHVINALSNLISFFMGSKVSPS